MEGFSYVRFEGLMWLGYIVIWAEGLSWLRSDSGGSQGHCVTDRGEGNISQTCGTCAGRSTPPLTGSNIVRGCN